MRKKLIIITIVILIGSVIGITASKAFLSMF